MNATDSEVPMIAAWLGGLGAAPFVALAGGTPFLTGLPRLLALHALLAYGATILSFLGGIHWGLAIAPQGRPDRGKLGARLTLSVMPSLVGWGALLFPERPGLLILALAIAAMLWVDLRATRLGQAPPWYPKLRIPLSCVVIASLVLGAIA